MIRPALHNALRALQSVCASIVIFTASADAAPSTTRLVLNAPSCAQEIENYRRECLRSCEKSPIKAQCTRVCNDPDKLSPRLAQCEERKKPV